MSSYEIEILGLLAIMTVAILVVNGIGLALFVFCLAGVLNKKAEHFQPVMTMIIDLAVMLWVNIYIFCNPEMYEILRDLF